jgi:hypothetical protein
LKNFVWLITKLFARAVLKIFLKKPEALATKKPNIFSTIYENLGKIKMPYQSGASMKLRKN